MNHKLALIFLAMIGFGCANGTPTDQPNVTKQSTYLNSLRPRYAVGETIPRYSLADRMAHYGVPGVAIAVIQDGEIVSARGHGVLQAGSDTPVNADTLFSSGSVSKVATATMLLKMQAAGQISVDRPIDSYLTSWSMPKSEFGSASDITLRMILSHTAGFNIHGFGDFQPGQDLPTVHDTLNGKSPALHGPLSLLSKPGERYKYSGGGYTLAQLIVADVGKTTFEEMGRRFLLEPLGLTRSTFENPLLESTPNVAKAHDRDGNPTALPRGYEAMPEMAASGLWTSANDLGRLVIELINSYQHPNGFLPQAVAQDMMTKVSPSEHGLGPRIEGTMTQRFFHHAGANNSYHTWIEGHLVTGDGLVVLTNGANGNDLHREIRNAVADAYGWEINKLVNIPKIRLDTDRPHSYAGHYTAKANYPLAEREHLVGGFYDSTLVVTVEGDALFVATTNRPDKYPLIPAAPNRFVLPVLRLREGVGELVFHRNGNGQTTSMTLEVPGARAFFERTDE